jgi:glycosyltransferase involved in cell wall biosynthesis
MAPRLSVLELRSVRGTGGGPEKTILFGAALRDRQRFDVTVCYVRDLRDEVFGIDQRAGALDIDYVEARERHSFDPGIWQTLKTIVRDRGIDIVHSHDYKTDLLALLLAWRLGITPISTAHGWTGQSAKERYIYYPGGKRLLARFPHVIAVSTDIKNELVRHGARPERVSVILNGIDPGAFQRTPEREEAVRRTLGYEPGHFVIGAVGRLERQKRFDLLLTACQPLLEDNRSWRVAIAGDGSLRADLESLIDTLGIRSQATLLGHRQDINELHHAFNLFVQSSEYEGTPNAVLEAMALETPLVATDVGGTSELAHDGVHALIVPNHDPAALQRAMLAAFADRGSAQARARAARRRIETELSFDHRTRRLEATYEALASGPVRNTASRRFWNHA